MTTSQRVRLAVLLTFFTLAPLAAVIAGAVVLWDDWSGAAQAITAFVIVMFTVAVGFSGSIAFDRRLESVPWLRIGSVGLFLLLGCGVVWVRGMV